jgi:2',3'-cyclic-nucleotide 2'-phosphodiesterase (5'-nucleotidase family)/phage tail protein X
MKRIKPILAALLLVLALVIAIPTLAQAAGPDEGSTTITILHTNDLHGRFVGNSTNIIGVDRIAAIYAATDNAILVDAGDTLHGLPFVNLSQGVNAVKLMNAAGYRLMAPGNHDFNYSINPLTGENHLLYLETLADFDILAANLTWADTGEPVFAGYTIVEIADVKVGFFGLVFPDTPTVTHPDGVADFTFGDPVAPARRAVAALQAAGADVIVAIAHLGDEVDALGIIVAEQVPGIDVIIDGHSHSALPEGFMVGDVLVAQTGGHGSSVGAVEIVLVDGEIHSVSATLIDFEAAQAFEPAAAVAALIAEMNEANAEILEEVVGYNPVLLIGDRDVLRFMEAPLGNIVANALRWNVGADLAIANSGGIRVDLPAGDVTKGDISAVLPFTNFAVKVEVTPAILWEALEIGVSSPGHGRFPQVSGFSFAYDGEAEDGERIVSVTVNGTALGRNDTTTKLTLAINDFMSVGGDGYTMFIGLPVLAQGDLMADLLIAYMAAHDISGIGVENRIVNLAAARTGFLPIPVAGEALTYVAQADETLWSIAYNFYGSMQDNVINRIYAANAAVLAEANGAVTEGMVLTLPAQGLRDPITRTHDGELYLVRAGDTLSTIAYRFYGDASLASLILEANSARVRNINTIIAGQWLVIP